MNAVNEIFGGKVRIRVCGICIEHNSILLIKHDKLGELGELWAPPGGGINFNESTEDALKREFYEETGLKITVNKFLCVNEFHSGNLHAIELFFKVTRQKGSLKTGIDPELKADQQIIKEVKFVTFEDLIVIPNKKRHNILQGSVNEEYVLNMKGHFKLWQ
ncbi:NUDIX domain-containing protein [Fulvivirga lutimaris]|uniref:NUDIX domain-containing protein n=1 Tax=Fulvivirga lutimaris TaxID=1819566 RepID=UPI0012BC18B2|nr:NUDIX hydrolase [Fulvivirga lutimaris]MTI39369.1 NUDIX hydrolase [Fulvivirga lutimaris]